MGASKKAGPRFLWLQGAKESIMATAATALDNDTALDDFEEGPVGGGQESAEIHDDPQSQEPALDQEVDGSGNDEYVDLGDDLEQSGESTPPVETAKSVTEPADSGVVDDGESFPPELLKLTNLDAARAKAAFGTPERLEQAWLTQVLNAGREAAAQRQQQALQQPGQPQESSSPADTQAAPIPTQQELEDYLRLKLELPEEFADVEDNKLLFDALGNQVSQFYGPHLKRMEENFQRQQQVLQHFIEREEREQWARHDEEFDRFIDGLPDEWHELFGKERPEVGTPQHQARAQLFHAKSMIENGSRQLGQSVPLTRALELGLRTAFPTQHDTIIKKSVSTQRKNGPIRMARPNNRRSAPPSGDQAAINNLKSRMKELGTGEPSEGVSEDDFV